MSVSDEAREIARELRPAIGGAERLERNVQAVVVPRLEELRAERDAALAREAALREAIVKRIQEQGCDCGAYPEDDHTCIGGDLSAILDDLAPPTRRR